MTPGAENPCIAKLQSLRAAAQEDAQPVRQGVELCCSKGREKAQEDRQRPCVQHSHKQHTGPEPNLMDDLNLDREAFRQKKYKTPTSFSLELGKAHKNCHLQWSPAGVKAGWNYGKTAALSLSLGDTKSFGI